MAVSTKDLFGDSSPAGDPATPGTYGLAPRSGVRLPEATRLGVVRLQVADLARSIGFYEQVLGMRATRRDAGMATLAAHDDSTPLVELRERSGARPARRGALGLYHFAILLPDRRVLARWVRHLGARGIRTGTGDHLVSEAIYLSDPDGLGIEVYVDRPRATWRRQGRELMIATDPLDIAALLAEDAGTWTGMPAGTRIGHVHLHVGDLERADELYADTLGMDRTAWRYPGALFVSAGGYHHHLGLNTWAGPDAPPSADDEARLLEWTLEVPAASDVQAVAARLREAGHEVTADGDEAFTVTDPWGTTLRVRAG